MNTTCRDDLRTNSRFNKVSNIPNTDYLFFMASSFCKSPVGKRLGRKKQSLRVGGCDSFGKIIHEIMHSLGKSNCPPSHIKYYHYIPICKKLYRSFYQNNFY